MDLPIDLAVSGERAPGDTLFELCAGPFGPQQIRVMRFEGREEMNALYAFDVHFRLVSGAGPGPAGAIVAGLGAAEAVLAGTGTAEGFVAAVAEAVSGVEGDLEEALLGQPGRLVMHHEGWTRCIEGIITAVEAQGGHLHGGTNGVLRLMPRLSRLCRARTSRIFQGKTVVQIVDDVLGMHGVRREWILTRSYPTRAYCVQYQESDYDFVTRLLAEEGIMFFFRQPRRLATDPLPAVVEAVIAVAAAVVEGGDGGEGETLLLIDDVASHPSLPGESVLRCRGAGQTQAAEGSVATFSLRTRVGHESLMLREYDYRHPLFDLTWRSWSPEQEPDLATRVYEHHAEYERPDLVRNVAPTHLQQHRARLARGAGTSACRRLTAGHAFVLEQHDQAQLNGPYVVTRVDHAGHERWAPHPDAPDYIAAFRCVPAAIPFRPPRPPRPPRQVMETAVVVGPAGDEIHTDQLGRIKVQFHWDLDGKRNEHSSCFLRVVQTWAGASWGFQFIPRIGMEVLVSFIGGDLDNPVVVGSLYNAVDPPPFPLPMNKTQSGIRTRTTPGGDGYNELSFEDALGREQITLRAQRDLEEQVEHDRRLVVKGAETARIDRDAGLTVGGDRKVHVAGDCRETVAGDRARTVEGDAVEVVRGKADLRVTGDSTTRLEGRERREVAGRSDVVLRDDTTVRSLGCHTTLVGQHDAPRSYLVHVEGRAEISATSVTEIAADKGIVLRCGKSSIRLAPEGVEISAPALSLAADGVAIAMDGDDVRIKATKQVHIKSLELLAETEGASLGLSTEAKIAGSQILLNSPSRAKDVVTSSAPPPTKIALRDRQGRPIAGRRWVMTLDDGSERSGFLDDKGEVEIEVEAAGSIRFPELSKLEKA